MREQHPELRFRLITNEFAAHVGRLLPGVEEVYAYRKFGMDAASEWRQLLRARRWHANRVIGLSPSPDRKLALRTWLLGPSTQADFAGAPAHAAERLAWLFGWRPGATLPRAQLRLPEEQGTARDVAIWISARKPSNRPTPAQVVAVIRGLRDRRGGISIGVFGLPERTDSGAHVPDVQAQSEVDAMLRGEGLRLATPPLDALLGELAASASLISPDGGMAHAAAAFGKPVVALFGDVDPGAWRPWSSRVQVLQAPSRSVSDLDPAGIVDAWGGLLARPA